MHNDNVYAVVVEDKQLFVPPFVGDKEIDGEVGHNVLLRIDDLYEDLVGTCLQLFHR